MGYNSEENSEYKIDNDNACFTPSQENKDLCYGGYPWCEDCEMYINRDFVRGRKRKQNR